MASGTLWGDTPAIRRRSESSMASLVLSVGSDGGHPPTHRHGGVQEITFTVTLAALFAELLSGVAASTLAEATTRPT